MPGPDSHSKLNPISEGLTQVKARLLSSVPEQEAPLVAWAWICGQKVSQSSEAVRFENGELTVLVPDDSWRRELTGLSRSYLQRFDGLLPGKVMRIRFQKK